MKELVLNFSYCNENRYPYNLKFRKKFSYFKMVDQSPSQSGNKSGLLHYQQSLESLKSQTSFGALVLGHEHSQPQYSIGKSTRDQLDKTYVSNEHNGNSGSTGPGPKYRVQDNRKFNSAPKFSIGRDPRETMGHNAWYEHYEHNDMSTDTIRSKNRCMKQHGGVKIGTERKGRDQTNLLGPGPAYNPPHKMNQPRQPMYTMAARRDCGSALANATSTPKLVGPARYDTISAHTQNSERKKAPIHSFTRASRSDASFRNKAINQTYDTSQQSMGNQLNSRKKTQPRVSMPKSTRVQQSKLGTFKDMMATRPTTIRIAHPNF